MDDRPLHTVETLHQVLELAESLGYGVRFEFLGGASGGRCEVMGRRWLFVDLALNPVEQLDQVAAALRQDARIYASDMSHALRGVLGIRRCA